MLRASAGGTPAPSGCCPIRAPCIVLFALALGARRDRQEPRRAVDMRTDDRGPREHHVRPGRLAAEVPRDRRRFACLEDDRARDAATLDQNARRWNAQLERE